MTNRVVKGFFSLIILSFLALELKGQDSEFHHGVGGSYILSFDGNGSNNGTIGLTYAPRIALPISKESSVSLNVTPTLSFSAEINSSGASSSSFAYELPISVNYNFGYRSTNRSRSDAGGFVGLGYGLTNIKNSIQSSLLGVDEIQSEVNGFYLEGGGRFEFRTAAMRKRRMDPVSMTISLYTIQGGDKGSILGLRFIYNLN